jgi:hypothetical protein
MKMIESHKTVGGQCTYHFILRRDLCWTLKNSLGSLDGQEIKGNPVKGYNPFRER